MTDDRLSMFTERYQVQNTPWDTGITPPEIVAIVAELRPGKALDLGCGTGTNVRYLLEHGWQADGLDFVPEAIDRAREKLAAFPPEQYTVLCYDVTLLAECDQLRSPYDLVVDIGCGHGLPVDAQAQYAQTIAEMLKPGGTFMLYAHAPTPERPHGWGPDDVHPLFTPHLILKEQALSLDTTNGLPSGWYRWEKAAV